MIRRIITFIVVLMLSFSQIWVPGSGISIWSGTMELAYQDLLHQRAYAETKQTSPKSSSTTTLQKKGSVKPKPAVQKPDGITLESKNFPDWVTGRRYSFLLVPADK